MRLPFGAISEAIDRYLNGNDRVLQFARQNAHLAEWFSDHRLRERRRHQLKRALVWAPVLAIVAWTAVVGNIAAGLLVLVACGLTSQLIPKRPRGRFPSSLRELCSPTANRQVLLDLWMTGTTGTDLADNYVAEVGPRTLPSYIAMQCIPVSLWTLLVMIPAIINGGAIRWPHVVLWAAGIYCTRGLWKRPDSASMASSGACQMLRELWKERPLPKDSPGDLFPSIQLPSPREVRKRASELAHGLGCLAVFGAVIYGGALILKQPVTMRVILRLSDFAAWTYGLVWFLHYGQGYGALAWAALLLFICRGATPVATTTRVEGEAYFRQRGSLTRRFNAFIRSAIVTDHDWKRRIIVDKDTDGTNDAHEDDRKEEPPR